MGEAHCMKYTEYLFLATAMPIAVAKWVFPTPLVPTKRIFSLFSKNLKVSKSKICFLFTLGW